MSSQLVTRAETDAIGSLRDPVSMQSLQLVCNHCASALEVPPEAGYFTCVECGSRLRVESSSGALFTRVVIPHGTRSVRPLVDKIAAEERRDQMVSELELLKVENDLGRLERRWQAKRLKYLLVDRTGKLCVPDPRRFVVLAALAVFTTLGYVTVRLADGRMHGEHIAALTVLGIAVVIASIRAWTVTARVYAYHVEELRYERERTHFLRARRELHGAV